MIDLSLRTFVTEEILNNDSPIVDVCLQMMKFLCEKNRRYGNSALEPMGAFYKGNSADSILIRIDDKLQRVKNHSGPPRENDVVDLIGYLLLYCVSQGWNDFDKFLD
jgi:hypothetical protein